MNSPRGMRPFAGSRAAALRQADGYHDDPLQRAFFERHHVRTDLAFEAHQLAAQTSPGRTIPGVVSGEETRDFGSITRLEVQNDIGAGLMGKPPGRYVTIHVPRLREEWRALAADVAQALAAEIEQYFNLWGLPAGAEVLVVGLGNWNATPDNVGPLTVAKLLVTRHLHQYRVLDESLLGRLRPVAALSPGVLGLTGVETAEIVKGVVDAVRPGAVICIDALASQSIERVGTTIQLSDAGINPGSGVGNKRVGLTPQTLGVPVLAIGCPTVIYATTIVSEAVNRLGVDPLQRRTLSEQVLGAFQSSLIVTPKEIDQLVETLSNILADGLNDALHPGVTAEEARQLL